jgi:hypothetical protein
MVDCGDSHKMLSDCTSSVQDPVLFLAEFVEYDILMKFLMAV